MSQQTLPKTYSSIMHQNIYMYTFTNQGHTNT